VVLKAIDYFMLVSMSNESTEVLGKAITIMINFSDSSNGWTNLFVEGEKCNTIYNPLDSW
jgi:hypothetical protein